MKKISRRSESAHSTKDKRIRVVGTCRKVPLVIIIIIRCTLSVLSRTWVDVLPTSRYTNVWLSGRIEDAWSLKWKASANFSNIFDRYLTTCIHGENNLPNKSTLAIYHYIRKKLSEPTAFVHALHVIWLSKTAVAHALIVSPTTSWPGWTNKIVNMEKGWTD